MNKVQKNYKLVKYRPVCYFYYRGSHSHPVRRTVLVVESNSRVITGFELREGSEVRSYNRAPVKSYRRQRIAQVKQCGRRLRKRVDVRQHGNTTLQRVSLVDLVTRGV
jgi:hypothetical protein